MMKSKLRHLRGGFLTNGFLHRVIPAGVSKAVAFGSLAGLGLCLVCVKNGEALAGGSIVINASAPASELIYREDTGTTKPLKVTWTDIQVIDAMRRFLTGRFGASGADQPFYINRKANKVSFLDPNTETYSEVSFRELLGTR